MSQIRNSTPRKKLGAILIGYVLFFLVFGVIGSNQVIGMEPLIMGWLPAWLAATYVLSIVIMAYTYWVYDELSDWVLNGETAPTGRYDEAEASATPGRAGGE